MDHIDEVVLLSTVSTVKDEYSACCAASLIAQINAMKSLIKAYTPENAYQASANGSFWGTAKSDVEYLLHDREQLLTEVLRHLSDCVKQRR
jgi:hypothetical protein